MDKSVIDKLALDLNKSEVISFVGGGGKTTTIKKLAKELKNFDKKVLCTTSTAIEIFNKNDYDKIFVEEIHKEYIPEAGSITVFGDYIKNNRFYSSNIELVDGLIQRNIFDYVLIEADGSRQHPIKAPNTNEPVISKYTTITVGLIGLDSLDKKVEEIVHRSEIFKEIIDLKDHHILTYEDAIKLVKHDRGLFKNSKGRKILYLNKMKPSQVEIVNMIEDGLVGLGISVAIGKFEMNDILNLVAIRGGGDIATGIAHRLHMAGFKVVILEIEKPLSIRREVSFSEAIYRGQIVIEGIKSELANSLDDIYQILEDNNIPVIVDEFAKLIPTLKPIVLVDSILAKINLGTNKTMAPITIGVGPGFNAGEDVTIVIETVRGHNLGKVIYEGEAQKNTGIPESVMNYSDERVIRATKDGMVENLCQIGDFVDKDTAIIKIGDKYMIAKIPGVVRGLIKDGTMAKVGLKIADIDPRGIKEYAYTISDKAKAIGGGVLEGIMHFIREVE